MGVKQINGWSFAGLLVLILCGCGTARSNAITRLALLAPFEGRYREVGYDAYYAVRLALIDSGNEDVELLAVDDGGDTASAVDRAKALEKDPFVKAVIALGYAATNPVTQQAFERLPLVVVGQWGEKPEQTNVFILASADLNTIINAPDKVNITDVTSLKMPVVGGEIFALKQFTQLRSETDGIRIASNSTLPDSAFHERYIHSGLFVPEPGLLATLSYDAANMVLQAMQNGDTQTALATIAYSGINGNIRFEQGYWADAPIHYYCYKRTPSEIVTSTLYAC